MIGDSSAAAWACPIRCGAPGALIAGGLAAVAERPVQLVNVAKSGAQSADLERQTTLALAAEPEVALIMVGANDVTHQVRPADSVRRLEQATRRLLASGCEVVVGTCPDLGTIEPIAQPLRYIARQWSRSPAAAQTIAVVEAGSAHRVDRLPLLGPEFAARPGELFGPDRFHPSEKGYATAAMAILPSVCAARSTCGRSTSERPDSFRGEGRAADRGGGRRGRRGRRHRGRGYAGRGRRARSARALGAAAAPPPEADRRAGAVPGGGGRGGRARRRVA
ncbi:SGNH/GDSL hydrolase family protein [Yinghuangia aomiensis]